MPKCPDNRPEYGGMPDNIGCDICKDKTEKPKPFEHNYVIAFVSTPKCLDCGYWNKANKDCKLEMCAYTNKR